MFATEMKKEIATIKNPLTVISIFAGLAEVAGTVVLPFVAEANQLLYIWFLILFPALLVILFFATLNFNPRVLYAPSDFEDEQHYMDLFRPSSTAERLEKLESEVSQSEEPEKPAPKGTELDSGTPEVIDRKDRLWALMKQDTRSRYMLAESLIIDRLSQELGRAPKRDIALRNRFGSQLFDAVFEDKNQLILVETKFFSEQTYARRMRETFDRIQSSLSGLPEEVRQNAKFILAIGYEKIPQDRVVRFTNELQSMLLNFPMRTEVRMYDIVELIENAGTK